MIDDGYRRASQLIAQLKKDLDAIRDAEPGSEGHREAVAAYAETFRSLGRSAYTREAPVELPRDEERGSRSR